MLKIKLLFDGEGGTASEASAPADTQQAKKGEFKNVVFGKQEKTAEAKEPAAEAPKETAKVDRDKAYHDFVNGDYKDLYTKDVQRIINSRFKETKQMESKLAKQQELIDIVSQRFGGESDPDKLLKALNEDNLFWEEAADKAGMTVTQYKDYKKLEAENQKLIAERQRIANEQSAQAQVDKWTQEATELQTKFPAFRLQDEVNDPSFMRMLKAGIPMEHAYKVKYMDQIMNDTVRTTAAATSKAVVDNVRARGNRPSENGMSNQSSFTVKDDVSKLTKKERMEIANRVKRGAQISF